MAIFTTLRKLPVNQSIKPQKSYYAAQYIANISDYWLVHSVFEITFNKSMKSVIKKHAFQGGGEILPPLGE